MPPKLGEGYEQLLDARSDSSGTKSTPRLVATATSQDLESGVTVDTGSSLNADAAAPAPAPAGISARALFGISATLIDLGLASYAIYAFEKGHAFAEYAAPLLIVGREAVKMTGTVGYIAFKMLADSKSRKEAAAYATGAALVYAACSSLTYAATHAGYYDPPNGNGTHGNFSAGLFGPGNGTAPRDPMLKAASLHDIITGVGAGLCNLALSRVKLG